MSMAKADPQAVQAYLDALPEGRRTALAHLRDVILAAASDATERVSYGLPIFALDGDLVGMGAHSKHLSLYVMSTQLVAAMADDLAGVKVSGATIHFQEDDPLPDDLVTRIVAARVRENSERRRAR